jgi:hypothetical protein
MTPRLAFHGGAGTVTGSCFRVEHAQGSFLVDCGMFQGPKSVKELSYGSFPFDPPGVDFLLLTHAHIDHSGLVPKLCKHGFKGPIHATAPTVDLLAFMLPDSGHIQESEVERLNRRNRRRGKPEVTPIYTRTDAEACLAQARWSPTGTTTMPRVCCGCASCWTRCRVTPSGAGCCAGCMRNCRRSNRVAARQRPGYAWPIRWQPLALPHAPFDLLGARPPSEPAAHPARAVPAGH